MDMTSTEKFPAIFFFFFSLYICFESVRLGLGNWRKPGAGFLCFWAGVILGILALVVLFQSRRQKGTLEGSKEQVRWRGAIFGFLSLLAFMLIMDKLGFIVTTFLFIGFLLKVVERKSWITAAVTALAVTVSSYLLFEICLQSELPKGILENLGI